MFFIVYARWRKTKSDQMEPQRCLRGPLTKILHTLWMVIAPPVLYVSHVFLSVAGVAIITVAGDMPHAFA